MAGMIRDEDFRSDLGRATEGRTFLRVVHEPTQVSRVVVGLNVGIMNMARYSFSTR
jgi:glyoxylate carboligase